MRGGKALRGENDEWAWLSVDPMYSERSWLTPYNYVQNNPVYLIDPTGMIDAEPDPMKTVDLKPVDVKPQSWLSRTWDSVKSFFGMSWLGGKEMYGDSPEQGVTHRDGNATGDPIDLTETLEMIDALLYRKDGFRFKPKTKPSGEVKGKGVAEAINQPGTGEVGEMPGVPTPEVPSPEVSQPETLHVKY